MAQHATLELTHVGEKRIYSRKMPKHYICMTELRNDRQLLRNYFRINITHIKMNEEKNPLLFLSELQDFIEERYKKMPEGSYTTSLFKDGTNRMAQKVGEEALELVIEATNGTKARMVYEGADMLYHLIVLLTSKGMRIEDFAKELQVRHNPNWQKH